MDAYSRWPEFTARFIPLSMCGGFRLRIICRNLIRDLQNVSSGGGDHQNSISLVCDQIQTGPDAAVAIGIVATELVLNALKHAYPKEGGQVRVMLQAYASEIELAVEDDGVGCLDGIDGKRRRGLGQRIIAGMADKLEGCLRYEKLNPGTRAVLTFPIGNQIRVLETAPVAS